MNKNLYCAMLAISAMALLALWIRPSNAFFLIFLLAIWAFRWKTMRSVLPVIDKSDTRYLILATAFSALSGAIFFISVLKNSWLGNDVTTTTVAILALIGFVIAIPFTASSIKLFFEADKGNIDFPSLKPNTVISRNWPKFCYALGAFGIVILLAFSFNYDIWSDEAFSMALSKHNYSDLIKLTAEDVHPPLYYIILKAIVDGIHVLFPAIPAIFVAKTVSVLAYVLLFAIIVTKVRRNYGQYVAALGVVCLVGMNRMMDFGTEVRMYSWGIFFVTLAFLVVKDVLEKCRFLDWAMFVVFSLCAAYTHYFACVAVGFLYIVLLWSIWKNDRKRLWQWIIASIITVVGYLPWLTILIGQLHEVSEDYWIDDLDFGRVAMCVMSMINTPLLLLAIFYLLFMTVKSFRSKLTNDDNIALTGILVPVFVFAVGVIVSYLMRPIFIWRYLVPSFCCFWLGILILVNLKCNRQLRIIIAAIIVLTFFGNIADFSYRQCVLINENQKLMSFFNSQPEESAYIIIEGDKGVSQMIELSHRKCYPWKEKENEGINPQDCYDASPIKNVHEILPLLLRHQPVYIAVDRQSAKPITAMLEGSNLSYVYEKELHLSHGYDLEMITIDLYRLALQSEEQQ